MKRTIRIIETDTGYDVADSVLEILGSLGISARYTTHSADHVDLEISVPSIGSGRRLAGGKDASPAETQGVLQVVRLCLEPLSPSGFLRAAAWDPDVEEFAKMREDIQATFGESDFLAEPPSTLCVRRVEADPDGLRAEVRIVF